MIKYYLFFVCLFIISKADAQCGGTPINHWESCVLETMPFRYTVPSAAISGWQLSSFNDAAWSVGAGGIGYGDGDDNTVVTNPTRTVYMRKAFNIIDTSAIKSAVFCMDYDDGFVAFLNGKEFARSNMAPNQLWNSFSIGQHEANMYQGLPIEYFVIPPASLDTLLVNGINVLSIEVHNATSNSPDLSSRPFLQLAILNSTYNYSPVPSWFVPPVSFESKLPIISINTLGQSIVDDPRITCDMSIVYNGVGMLNCSEGPFNHYYGKITIEHRGSTSQSFFPKKPYGFTTVDLSGNSVDVSLLGMPAENDWILLAPYTDKTFMRDALTYDLMRDMQWYSSRKQFVEVLINGQNMGVHVLLEKIKRDDNRVDISKITNTMNSGDSLTGGYIFKVDKTTGSSGGGWNTTNGISIQNHDPDWNEITVTQRTYLQNYINTFESALWGTSFADPNLGYRKYANVYSFADLFIMNEVSNNIDGYRLSTFVHKDRDSRCGRFTMGPVWDYNLSFGNGDYCNGNITSGWQLYAGCGLDGGGYWMDKMLQDQWFRNLLNCRWIELRQTKLSNATLLARIDTNANYLREASMRDSTIWQTLGTYVWPNGWVANTWQAEVDSMKAWLIGRLAWMDANMYPASQSCNSLANVSLVIDELNFNSDNTINAGDWLELYNYGNTAIDLSNAVLLDNDNYEKYCVLPNNTILNGGQRLVVYEDAAAFTAQYPGVTNKIGPLCFKLSNGGQKITLRDKNNKLITQFTYADSWQCAADGQGRTLQLVSPTSIPANAASWFAGCIGGSPGVAYTPCNESLICTEINYNSSLAEDAGDWFELFNESSAPIILDSYTVRDGSNSMVYSIPSGTTLNPNQYLVLYSDAAKFNTQFPSVTNKRGPLGFAFNNTGDVIRLYNSAGKLVYSICYQSALPWPTAANGGGKTLENGQYGGNHNAASSWFAGCPEGSPGFAYNPACYPVALNEVNSQKGFVSIYPNPASDRLYVQTNVRFNRLRIMNMLGQEISSGYESSSEISITHLPSGNYILTGEDKDQTYQLKFSKK